ncbi:MULTISPECIES: uracil-DNA glycosylase [unclassified Aureimonas]|uniref:uracil-DNA glycosylase n=1 Tax=unclassified Aureimonas TaxID=2615206 RepID=UPI000700F1F3|nr:MULTISPECIES: uracil-DNA glycosylase [unclassified Aureimonas]KQT55391.1 DNA polymerase [Aureimonas sp. Leaf427]KQT71179.1 DNA polymerase [Aureimonas sp. Leaf460]
MSDARETHTARDALAALLDWYAQAGVDVILEDAPRDRFAETAAESASRRPAARSAERPTAEEAPRRETALAPPPAAPQRTVVPDDVAVADARERARSASTLGELQAALAAFEGCNLRLAARHLVFGEGPEDATLMIIGEAPERDEDMAGAPFAGRAGTLLERMLAAIGLERSAVRLAAALPWRPPGGRVPTPAEIEICLPFLARHVELVRPKAIVTFGMLGPRMLLRSEGNIARLRGRWQTYSFGILPDEAVPVLPMLHPTYLLNHPAQKRLAWTDLLALRERLNAAG